MSTPFEFDDVVKTSAVPERNPAASWSTGLMGCCSDAGSCCEVAMAEPCQQATQYNLLTHGRDAVHWPVCLGVFALDILGMAATCLPITFGSAALTFELRQRLRAKYGLAGSDIEDALASIFCAECSACQNMREMKLNGDAPGSAFSLNTRAAYNPLPQAPQ